MKVIKRDGRIVEYDRSKIKIAIEKANNEVTKSEKATEKDIKSIIQYIEELNKKRILVEDIQDIIEQKLMELGRYELAKRYIVYRYTRALIRKSNTTDASILGLIRNADKGFSNLNTNKDAIMASTQKNLIVGEVSKDLTKRILLPEKIIKAWEDGVLYFHDSEYFIQPIFNSCTVNMGDMLDNGTVINGQMLESPKSFSVACNIMTQIMAAVASNQYGEQTVDMKCLGKYLRKSKQKIEKEIKEELGENSDKKDIKKIVEKRLKSELTTGIQTIQYQINTLMTTNGRPPAVTLILEIKEDDEYIKENADIIEEILNQRIVGMKDETGEYITPKYPKLTYILNEINDVENGKYGYLTKLANECTLKRIYPEYKTKNDEIAGSFNQGVVSINLAQIGIEAEENEDDFWTLLEERLELCKEALMCRHYALVGTSSDISPIHWRHGAIARLEKGQKINNLLYGKCTSLYLGYIGLCEMVKAMKNTECTEQEGKSFAKKVLDFIKNKTTTWTKESNIVFKPYELSDNDASKELIMTDKENYGTIQGVTDKDYYTNICDLNY